MLLRNPASKLLLGSLALLGAQRAVALEPEDVLFFKAGPLTLRPQFSLAEVYNDNLFYQAQDRIQDFITDIGPGLKLQLGRPEHNYISLGYTLDELLYIDNPDLDAPQHSVELLDQFLFQRLKIIGSDRFQYLSSPVGGVVEQIVSPVGIATTVGKNVDRVSFDDNYTVSYDLGEKTSTYVRVTHYSLDYQQQVALYDIQTVTGTLGFGYRAFPKTIFFGEVYYGQTATDPNMPLLPANPDMSFVGGYAGVRGNFTQKLSGMVKAGYEVREFSDGSTSFGDPVVDLALTQRFSEKQSASLTYSRLSNVSIQYTRQSYTADTVGVQFMQILAPSHKWRANLGGSYAMYQYEQAGGSTFSALQYSYDYVRASVSLAYQMQRWATASLGYDFDHVIGDSRAVVDYDVNRVTLRFAIGY
jgi:hypothetical protein